MVKLETFSEAEVSGMTCATIIPAYNEATTIAEVVRVARAAKLGKVLVVDDGSSDPTAKIATQAGAQVIHLNQNLGKGGAVVAGVKQVNTDIVLLIDADLIGLEPYHLHNLVKPLLQSELDMTRGNFKSGRWQTNFSQAITPILNGQRAILRSKLLSIPNLAHTRYGIEVTISLTAQKENWQVAHVPLYGVSQVMKEEKANQGFVKGFVRRLKMYLEILRALTNFSGKGT